MLETGPQDSPRAVRGQKHYGSTQNKGNLKRGSGVVSKLVGVGATSPASGSRLLLQREIRTLHPCVCVRVRLCSHI